MQDLEQQTSQPQLLAKPLPRPKRAMTAASQQPLTRHERLSIKIKHLCFARASSFGTRCRPPREVKRRRPESNTEDGNDMGPESLSEDKDIKSKHAAILAKREEALRLRNEHEFRMVEEPEYRRRFQEAAARGRQPFRMEWFTRMSIGSLKYCVS